jgi:cobalt/nickel transport system permease protein
MNAEFGLASGPGTAPAGPIGRVDPRVRLLATLAFVAAVVATPLDRPRLLAAGALVLAFVVGLAGVSTATLLRRWAGFAALVGFLSVLLALSHPRRADLGVGGVAAALVARNSLAFAAVWLLSATTPFPALLSAMARLRVPAVLVATLHFMYRYLHVLRDELARMVQARRARSFRRRGALDWGLLSGLIGVLFLRAMERGERVHSAMRARGWDGTLRTLDIGDDG